MAARPHRLAGMGMMALLALAGCKDEKSAKIEIRKPTASEVFALRSKCAQLGDMILVRMQTRPDDAGAEDTVRMDIASDAGVKTHYNPGTNRCFVQVDVGTINPDAENWQATRYLYDGQTREMLAWFTTRGNAEADKCQEFLSLPKTRSCAAVNDKILALMADDRQQ